MTLMLVVLLPLTVTALSVTLWGEWMIGRIPAIKQVREAHRTWGCLRMKDASIANNQMSAVVQLRFGELSEQGNDVAILQQVQNKRFGDVVTIIWYKERGLRNLINEIRTYCALFLILLLAGVMLSYNPQPSSTGTLSEAAEGVLSYHVVPYLEVLMLVYLFIRLLTETQSLKSLFEE